MKSSKLFIQLSAAFCVCLAGFGCGDDSTAFDGNQGVSADADAANDLGGVDAGETDGADGQDGQDGSGDVLLIDLAIADGQGLDQQPGDSQEPDGLDGDAAAADQLPLDADSADNGDASSDTGGLDDATGLDAAADTDLGDGALTDAADGSGDTAVDSSGDADSSGDTGGPGADSSDGGSFKPNPIMWNPACFWCHGDQSRNDPAPPLDNSANSDTAKPSVGAHSAHVGLADWHKVVACTECHAVPNSILDPLVPTHANGKTDLIWGPLAGKAEYDFAAVNCTSSYCHGATLAPDSVGHTSLREPIWNKLDGSQDACGSACHTNPPGGAHPQNDKCADCHTSVIAGYSAANKSAVWKDANLHVDGQVQVAGSALTCTSCHGNPVSKNPAPPKGTKGETLSSQPAVGAHTQHLSPSNWHRDGACIDCHTVPAVMQHSDGNAQLVWGDLALSDAATPVFDKAKVTCSGNYCHGSTLIAAAGATTKTAPVWTLTDGSQTACGTSCHTNPPGGNHPKVDQCQMCHAPVIESYDPVKKTAIWLNADLHVDGKIETATMTCTTCHGDPAANDPAPPKGTKGETLTIQTAVGAHAKHLDKATWHRDGQCSDCHSVPTDNLHTSGSVEMTWGGLATADQAKPTWDKVKCSGSYCHGATLQPAAVGGAVQRAPTWTKVDGTQAACGSTCHTNPPGGTHPQASACEQCHTSVISKFAAGNPPIVNWKDASLHVDGTVQVSSLNCTSCHGDAVSKNPAPPKGTKGETLTTQAAVGAHSQHLGVSGWHRGGQCTDCHSDTTSVTHSNGKLDLTWAGTSAVDGAAPAFDAAKLTCAGTYCHGSTLMGPKTGGAVKRTPLWNQVDNTYDACGSSCHTNPPAAPHPQSNACASCHTPIKTYDAANPAATAWNSPEKHVDGKIDLATMTCTSCHGDAASNNPAPPKAVNGAALTADPGVGAHAQHLGSSPWHRDGQCADCHQSPSSMQHSNGKTEFAFGAPSNADGALPAYDKAQTTCTGSYCHGTTLQPAKSGATAVTLPKWNKVDGSQSACGSSCHTNPPGGTHPASDQCQLCHDTVISGYDAAAKKATWKNSKLHINGKIDSSALSCTSCHGDPASNNPAPPKGSKGEILTTQTAVGAHAKHLSKANWHRDGTCVDCHTVPTSNLHASGAAELTWGALATTDLAKPAWDKVKCSGSYCHGSTLQPAASGGIVNRSPNWTKVDGSQASCGDTCHTNPPGGTHPQSSACEQCHTSVVSKFVPGNPPTVTWANGAQHIDGKVQVQSLNCTSCHGDAASNNPAPPKGTKGETLTTQAAVGAHSQHLGGSSWHRSGLCTDCHAETTAVLHSNGKLDMTWAGTSAVDGAAPAFDAAKLTCAGTYCHGTTLAGPKTGGSVKRTPLWTQVDNSYDACGSSCHTNPPAAPHPQSDACSSCHTPIKAYNPANPAATTWNNAALHVDGKIDLATLNCTTCHGDAATNNPAPPKAINGASAATDPGVGAHAQHLGTSSWHRDGQCADCHQVPASPQHSNGKTDLLFAAPSNADGALPAYDKPQTTCTGSYCHGTTLQPAKSGATAVTLPKWNKVDGSQSACGSSCHTNPPGGTHPAGDQCQLCHDTVISAYDAAAKKATWKDSKLHINGKVESSALTCTSCHGDPASNDPAPPKGTKGEVQTSQTAVGAHAKHLAKANWHRDGTCVDCHTVPTSNLHASGAAELTWGALATTDLAKPAWDKVKCSGSYCHGSTLQPAASGGIVNRSPNWTKVDGSQASCGDTCHTNPPGGTHPQSSACEQCHTEVIAKFTAGTPPTVVWGNAALHVDGKVQVKSLNCTSCHGDTVSKNPAPPKGTKGETLTSQAAVGAHAQHLGVSGWHRAGLCTDCHSDTADVLHSNGKLDLAWNGTAALDGAAPSFDPAKLTCASTYCHGSTLTGPKTGGTVKRTPLWTQVDNSYDACGSSCHTNPPAAPHPQSNACASCHTPIKAYNAANPAASTWNNAALHVDGKIDLATLNCTTCHGDAVSNDPSPPKAVNGATVTADPGVGAHAQHLGSSTWHRDGACTDCHQVPASNLHTNGVTEVAFGAPGNADGALPAYDKVQTTCTGSYCHGTTLQPAKTGATAVTAPKWNKVDGSQSACGSSCHTNPPGGTHSQHADCKICHTAVIAAFDTQTSAAVWFDRVKHINGTVESNKYHDLGGWTSPKFNGNHHGSKYFVANQQKDEHNAPCTQCHGADLLGGTVGVSCNTSCHNGDWRSCDFCHGTKPGQSAPPIGVANETAITTLGVGRHTAHLTASATHTAIACPTCHLVPATGDVSHALGYVFSANLTTPGHHGDVTFSGAATTGMGFNVNATAGNPVTARGTCSGGCHSNGKGGAPAVTAYWAGGNWTKGSCTACHGNPPNNGEHSKHMQEGLTCLSCHPAANGASHMNGKRDVNATITGPQGGSVKATPPTGTGNCATAYRCTGTCHGENHQSECW